MKKMLNQTVPTISAPATNMPDATSWTTIQAVGDIAAPSYSLLVRDAAEALTLLPSESVNTCLTSPPYWGARDYEHENQIGLEEDVEEYIVKLVRIFAEVKRVLAT